MRARSLQLLSPDDVTSTPRFGDDVAVAIAQDVARGARDADRCRADGLLVVSEEDWCDAAAHDAFCVRLRTRLDDRLIARARAPLARILPLRPPP